MPSAIQRFYKQTSLVPFDEDNVTRYTIHLDGKPLNTPSKNPFKVHNEALAKLVQHEWNSQAQTIDPVTMPVYSILVTSIDKSSDEDKESIISELSPYIDGDLMFYHAPDPVGLTQYQSELWGGAIDAFEHRYNVRPSITHDLVALKQSSDYHRVIMDEIQSMSDVEFTIFHVLVSLGGSPLVACLAIRGEYGAQAIIKILNAESDFYQKHYKFNADDIAPDERKKNELLQIDINACMAILDTLKI